MAGDALPQGGRRVEQEQMHVTRVGERPQDVEVPGWEPGEPEQREPPRQGDDVRLGAEPLERAGEPLGRAGAADPLAQAPPQLRLPGGVGLPRLAARPCADHLRAV
jgi:hypothetical protein